MTGPRPDAWRHQQRSPHDHDLRGRPQQPEPAWDQLFAPDGDLSVRRARATAAQPRRARKPAVIAVAALVAVLAVVAGVVAVVSLRSPDAGTQASSASASPTPSIDADASQRLRSQLPAGYTPSVCHAVEAPAGASAEITCLANGDPGGPTSATYVAATNGSELQKIYDAAAAKVSPVVCPGNIQSPGPWRRNATPERSAGILLCGTANGAPVVIWTDLTKMTVNQVQGGPRGPLLPDLYAWWSSHS